MTAIGGPAAGRIGGDAPHKLTTEQMATVGALAAVAVASLAFDLSIGLTAFTAAVLLQFAFPRSGAGAERQVAWGVVLLVCGVVTYVGALQRYGIGHESSLDVYRLRGGAPPRRRPAPRVTEIYTGSVVSGRAWTVTVGHAEHVLPYLECLAFRLDSDDGSVCYSGDSRPTDALVELARRLTRRLRSPSGQCRPGPEGWREDARAHAHPTGPRHAGPARPHHPRRAADLRRPRRLG